MSHTPGPYKINFEDVGDEFACIVPVGLVTISGKNVIAQNGGLAPHDEEWNSEELLKNAHLFAAAPEMLEALEAMVEMVEMNGLGKQYALDLAASAIRKARGEA